MYYSSGNYEAFARPVKPEGVEHKSAYLVGSGLAALTAACYLVRDGQMPGRNIHIRADVAIQLAHKALAERHDLAIGFAFGIKIRAAFAAADGQTGQRVFEDLLKSQEFNDTQVHRGVQTQTTLVRSNGIVELHTITGVDMGLTLVVHPRHTEHDLTIRLDQTLQQRLFAVLLFVRFDHGTQRIQNLFYRLQEFRLAGIFGYDLFDYFVNIRHT